MNSALLRIEYLGRDFGYRKVFDSGIIEVNSPRWIALCGPNGSGKTTLIRILSTLCLPTAGDAKILGYSVVKQSEKIKPLIGASLVGEGGFFKKLTGHENLKIFGGLRAVSSKDLESQIERWMQVLPIRETLDRPYGLASSGQKQALHLVRAFIHSPKIVFLDEPTRSLDTLSADRFLSECRRLAKNTLVISSTHRAAEKSMTPYSWVIEKQFLSSLVKKVVSPHSDSRVWVSPESI
ncbi:MAG: ABC transporter ATP-binding protein [Bdellovibrionota bacterium]